MKRSHAITESPIGDLVIVNCDDQIVRISLLGQAHLPDAREFGVRDDRGSPEARSQLAEYFAGQRHSFELALEANGTAFQRRVWRALASIPYGATWSYGELAAALGQPSAVRAVGLANSRNPHTIVVPCHRVIGANGRLTGYAGGLANKATLLELEGCVLDASRTRVATALVPATL